MKTNKINKTKIKNILIICVILTINSLCINKLFSKTATFEFEYIEAVAPEISNNGTDKVGTGFCFNNPLPVELASFTSSVNGNYVTLNWTTIMETNNSRFDIERKSVLIKGWTKVGSVAGNGNTNKPKNYTFSEKINTGRYNYRLKQIDFNGNFVYFLLSNELIVGVPNKHNMSQNYPIPFNPITRINYELPITNYVTLKIYDIVGKEVATLVNEKQSASGGAGRYSIQFDGSNFASGIYFYRIKTLLKFERLIK